MQKNVSISIPPEMIKQIDKASKREHRTRSELVREAIRTYIQAESHYDLATPNELAEIEQGRKEIRKGEYITLDQLFHDMGGHPRKADKKRFRKIPNNELIDITEALKEMKDNPFSGDVRRLKNDPRGVFRRRV